MRATAPFPQSLQPTSLPCPSGRHGGYSALAWLGAATLALGLAGCASSPPATPSNTADLPPMPLISRLSDEQAQQVTLAALGLVGTPYRYGGNTPEGGFDCSGLIGYVFRTQVDLVPPRTVAALAGWGQPVDLAQLRTGDLVLFGNGGPPSHAGIYVGEGRFVHAPSSGGQVRLERLDARHWARQRISGRRP
ncbi:MAG: C40 family peptidase [Tibeticola sp.]